MCLQKGIWFNLIRRGAETNSVRRIHKIAVIRQQQNHAQGRTPTRKLSPDLNTLALHFHRQIVDESTVCTVRACVRYLKPSQMVFVGHLPVPTARLEKTLLHAWGRISTVDKFCVTLMSTWQKNKIIPVIVRPLNVHVRPCTVNDQACSHYRKDQNRHCWNYKHF